MKYSLFALGLALAATSSFALWNPFDKAEDKPAAGAASAAVDVASSQNGHNAVELNPELIITEDDRVLGNPNAPVQIVEYASMTCSHCANFHNSVLPDIKRDYVETGKVKLVLRQMPWDPVAMAISKVAYCVDKEQYYPMISAYFATQSSWIQAEENILQEIKKIARTGGMSEEAFNTCMQNEELQQKLYFIQQAASQELNVRATPTIFVNNEHIEGGVPYATMKRVIDAHLAKVAPAQGGSAVHE